MKKYGHHKRCFFLVVTVYCKIELPKVANGNRRKLHL